MQIQSYRLNNYSKIIAIILKITNLKKNKNNKKVSL